jgi:hypothetical protein
MSPSTQSGSSCLPSNDAAGTPPRKSDDLTYQAMTVAAMLLLLASLWVF